MKKTVLFVIETLAIGGSEKSLITLLNLLDYSKYDVDLLVFSKGGAFEKNIPNEVNVLDIPEYFKYTIIPWKSVMEKIKRPQMMLSQLKYSATLRMRQYGFSEQAVKFWDICGPRFCCLPKEYDIAIAYAQSVPTFYVSDCVKAEKKYAWVNATYKPEGEYREYNLGKYRQFNKIVCVSDTIQSLFEKWFPEMKGCTTVIRDIMDADIITRMAEWESDAEQDMESGSIKLLTVGRLVNAKGYDIALDACEILKNRGLAFKWYILGKGYLEKDIHGIISEKRLENYICLLGARSNPYPYFKQASIYVQTSRHEGFGIAIAEARTLNVPVVTTKFDAVYTQMVNGENGLVVDVTSEAVADGIERLITDKALYDHIKEYQSQEKKGNTEELNKFYQLIES